MYVNICSGGEREVKWWSTFDSYIENFCNSWRHIKAIQQIGKLELVSPKSLSSVVSGQYDQVSSTNDSKHFSRGWKLTGLVLRSTDLWRCPTSLGRSARGDNYWLPRSSAGWDGTIVGWDRSSHPCQFPVSISGY